MIERMLYDLYSGARDLPLAEFGELGFDIVRSVLPIHSGMFGHGTYDARGYVTIHTLHRYEVPAERLYERMILSGSDSNNA